jgi:hypothetical protein
LLKIETSTTGTTGTPDKELTEVTNIDDKERFVNVNVTVDEMTILKIVNETKVQPFEIWNAVAAAGHIGNTIATYYLGDTKNFTVYEPYAKWTSHNDSMVCPKDNYVTTRDDKQWLVNPRAQAPTITISLFWLILLFHALSAIFQTYAGCNRRNYVTNVLQRGVNPLRFIEYSLSATIMLVCIALVSGIDDYHGLLAIETLTFTTMILGMVSELLFDDQLASRHLRWIGWVTHFTGWVTLMSAYVGVILKKYFYSIEQSEQGPPDWVTIIIFLIFALYNIFGITQFMQLCFKQPLCLKGYIPTKFKDPQKLNRWIENIYVANSLITKSILGWMIIVNTRSETNANFTLC